MYVCIQCSVWSLLACNSTSREFQSLGVAEESLFHVLFLPHERCSFVGMHGVVQPVDLKEKKIKHDRM